MKSMPARGDAITEGVVVDGGGDDSESILMFVFYRFFLNVKHLKW